MKIWKERVEEIRARLQEWVEYEEGERLCMELHALALNNYEPKHTDGEYMDFIGRNASDYSLTISDPQSTNHPYYMELFTIVSQHVDGDCLKECMDNAMDIAGEGDQP